LTAPGHGAAFPNALASAGVLPARKCQSCEPRKGMTHFENETFTVEHAGMTATVEGLPGWRCDA
jgi:YgiT-type zinc finger domain-containing protein